MLQGFSTVLTLYVDGLKTTLARSLEAGARLRSPEQETFTGDRLAVVEDPFGYAWGLVEIGDDRSIGEFNRQWDGTLKQRGQAPRNHSSEGGRAL